MSYRIWSINSGVSESGKKSLGYLINDSTNGEPSHEKPTFLHKHLQKVFSAFVLISNITIYLTYLLFPNS